MCSIGSVLMEYQDILDMKTTHAGPIPAERIEVGEGQVIFVFSILKGFCHETDKLYWQNWIVLGLNKNRSQLVFGFHKMFLWWATHLPIYLQLRSKHIWEIILIGDFFHPLQYCKWPEQYSNRSMWTFKHIRAAHKKLYITYRNWNSGPIGTGVHQMNQ